MDTRGESVELTRPPVDIRDGVRRALTAAPSFNGLEAVDRRAIAHALVRIAHAARLLESEAGEPVRPLTATRAMNAGNELSGTAVDRMAGTTRRMLNAISFPRFVNELITGVFRAMLETNQQQLQQYVELVRGVSQSLEGFSSLVGDENAARRWLAEQFPLSYELEEPDPDDPPDPEDGPEPLRLVSVGPAPSADALRAALSLEPDAEMPSGDGNALVRFVRRALARNRQQMLATMIQMGMQRIVVDAGRIHASMRFHIDASSAAAEDRATRFDTRTTIGASAKAAFGPFSASASVNSTIGYVSTTDVSTREELNASADLNSSVELQFRTDQVPLDRIASQQTVERLKLNTLNPAKEMEIAQQADAARLEHRKAMEAARASRPRLEGAPQVTPTAPSPPDPTPSGGRANTGGGGGNQAGAGVARTSAPPAAPGTAGPATGSGSTTNPQRTTSAPGGTAADGHRGTASLPQTDAPPAGARSNTATSGNGATAPPATSPPSAATGPTTAASQS